jgi:hypothetical protein
MTKNRNNRNINNNNNTNYIGEMLVMTEPDEQINFYSKN